MNPKYGSISASLFLLCCLLMLCSVPGGLVGYPRAYKNQFREFNSHRVHILVGSFSCIRIDWRKARERELATFD